MCSGCIELGEIIHDLANYDTIQEVKDVLKNKLASLFVFDYG